ncbi:hypothetical protein EDD18DRAFT_569555 [Armillaria luteobubalina]|uniref:Uncharacterized protein n=1 Tax=Armillaria luteobubalina TaxID=153913 RepID=A0AA39PU13_9AGAR|nr:hypothetical protein EDD18DRAFT_569555 [Armillaria luteobubalina]
MDLNITISENIATDILFNTDLLAIICKDLWDTVKRDGCPVSPSGDHIHPLVSLALTCKAMSSLALDTLWRDTQAYGFQPVLRIFPSASSGNLQVLPEDIPDQTWIRFRQYANRVRNITFDPTSCASFSSTVFLRLAEYQTPIFPKVQCLRSDVSFAASPSILLFLPVKNTERNTIDVQPLDGPQYVISMYSGHQMAGPCIANTPRLLSRVRQWPESRCSLHRSMLHCQPRRLQKSALFVYQIPLGRL